MKIKLLFVLTLLNFLELKSQTKTEEQLQIDYWNYRDRLRKYFLPLLVL
jgi:hypothetical protein